MNKVHHTPFSRIKSVFANITADEARAKGYVKGKKKVDEVFPLLKRVTTPVTVYKKQTLDRDDIIDIVDMDVVAWLKKEMRMMLDEELARAILVGDGRNQSSSDKINEQNIRRFGQTMTCIPLKQLFRSPKKQLVRKRLKHLSKLQLDPEKNTKVLEIRTCILMKIF